MANNARRSRSLTFRVLFLASLWAALALIVIACTALGPLAVAQGLPLPWGLLLLSLGPAIAIVYNERGRRHCTEAFAVR